MPSFSTDFDDRRGVAEQYPSARSLWGLDWLNFSMADVQNGLGPYLTVFLKGARNWSAGDIGIALAVSSIAGVSQIPVGMLVDALRMKRLLVALAGLLIAIGCLVIAIQPTFFWVVGAQVVIGIASAVLPPALAALCLGLVGHRRLPAQLSRNQGFNHAGGFSAAILIGADAHVWGYDWIFFLVCAFAAGTVAAAFSIRSGDIDHELARGGEEVQPSWVHKQPLSLRDLLGYRNLIVFVRRHPVPFRQRCHVAHGSPGAGSHPSGHGHRSAQRLHYRGAAGDDRRRHRGWPGAGCGIRA
jgi:Major Facilitator Superfamily